MPASYCVHAAHCAADTCASSARLKPGRRAQIAQHRQNTMDDGGEAACLLRHLVPKTRPSDFQCQRESPSSTLMITRPSRGGRLGPRPGKDRQGRAGRAGRARSRSVAYIPGGNSRTPKTPVPIMRKHYVLHSRKRRYSVGEVLTHSLAANLSVRNCMSDYICTFTETCQDQQRMIQVQHRQKLSRSHKAPCEQDEPFHQ